MEAARLGAWRRLRRLLEFYTVALEPICNISFNSFRQFNIGIAAIFIPLLQLGDAAAI